MPEWAGGHHEKMDGTGYPRGLKRDEMSIPARIMMIADIFEALTAHDRPYKARKMLSECIDIMARMSRECHIDPDLFELFLTSGVYREYAQKYLSADQIDAVDITRYLGVQRSGTRTDMTEPPIAVRRVSQPRPASNPSASERRRAGHVAKVSGCS